MSTPSGILGNGNTNFERRLANPNNGRSLTTQPEPFTQVAEVVAIAGVAVPLVAAACVAGGCEALAVGALRAGQVARAAGRPAAEAALETLGGVIDLPIKGIRSIYKIK